MIMNIIIVLAKSRVSQRLACSSLLRSSCLPAASQPASFQGTLVWLWPYSPLVSCPAVSISCCLSVLRAVAWLRFFCGEFIASRLEGFQGQGGMPESWAGRWDNLQTYFFPDLFNHGNWFLGVRPAPRIPAFETWREWVYLESGYLWLLWIGGIPFLAAFFFFAIVSLRTLQHVARERTDAIGVAAVSAFSYLVAMIVTMLFDPHLTLRGSADLFFPLLALSLVDSRSWRTPLLLFRIGFW